MKLGSDNARGTDAALELLLSERGRRWFASGASVPDGDDSSGQSQVKSFRAAKTKPRLGLVSSEGSFTAVACRRYEGSVEKAWVVTGHSGTKSLMVEFVAGYSSDLGVEYTLVSVCDAGVRSRPQRTCEVLSWRSVLEFSILTRSTLEGVNAYP